MSSDDRERWWRHDANASNEYRIQNEAILHERKENIEIAGPKEIEQFSQS